MINKLLLTLFICASIAAPGYAYIQTTQIATGSAVVTSSVTSSVDLGPHAAEISTFLLTFTGGPSAVTAQIQVSPDGSTWSSVDGAAQALTAAELSNGASCFSFEGTVRFIRLKFTAVVGTANMTAWHWTRGRAEL